MPLDYKIIESNQIKTLTDHVKPGTVVILDLDNTVMESQLELGSDQWFVQLCVQASTFIADKTEALAFAIALYHEIQKIVRTQAVEKEVVDIIKSLQASGIPVIAVTARDACLEHATVRQLHDIGIHLEGFKLPRKEFTVNGRPVASVGGIIYCGGQDKGLCFQGAVEGTGIKIPAAIMVDDKGKYLDQVRLVAEAVGIKEYTGIRYGHLDAKVRLLDMSKAGHQLASVKDRLPVALHEHISRLCPVPAPTAAESVICYAAFFYGAHAAPAPLVEGVVAVAEALPGEPRPNVLKRRYDGDIGLFAPSPKRRRISDYDEGPHHAANVI